MTVWCNPAVSISHEHKNGEWRENGYIWYFMFHRRVWISYYRHTNSGAEGSKLGKWRMENPHNGENL